MHNLILDGFNDEMEKVAFTGKQLAKRLLNRLPKNHTAVDIDNLGKRIRKGVRDIMKKEGPGPGLQWNASKASIRNNAYSEVNDAFIDALAKFPKERMGF